MVDMQMLAALQKAQQDAEHQRMLGMGFILDQICKFHGQTLLKERQYEDVIMMLRKQVAELTPKPVSDKPNLTALDGGRDKAPEDTPPAS